MSNVLSIGFNSGMTHIQQTVDIMDKDVDSDELICGLSDGSFLTTMSFSERGPTFIIRSNGNRDAIVIVINQVISNQEPYTEMFDDFEVTE